MTDELAQQLSVTYFLAKLSEQFKGIDQTNALGRMASICERLQTYENSQNYKFDHGNTTSEQQLIEAKKEFCFAWSLCELTQHVSQHELGNWQTRFAEVSIDYALKLAWQEVAKKHKIVQTTLDQNQGLMPGLFIFGMGKLGGYDLNFSSDVDLVAYFNPQDLPVPDALGKAYICHQVLQELTRILSQKGQRNFIWRVDWRLRPNASSMNLAMSVEAAREYYFYQASPWHRLALMKARVVAGDKRCGDDFLNGLTPFIWRQNLDYRAIDELAQIKQRINLEHPALRVQRTWREPISDDVGGFNVKLGSGGIRDIEFVTNALQLVWGGKHYSLRVPNTIDALQALAQKQLIDQDVAKQLMTSYQVLRRIENALQMRENLQTHLIPQSSQGQTALLILLGLGEQNWPDFVENLNTHRRLVNELFVDLFADRESEQSALIIWPTKLNQQANDVIEAWENGFNRYGVSNQVQTKLRPLAQALAKKLNESEANDVSEQVIRLDAFFGTLPAAEQYLRLLAESPALLNKFVAPLMYSPSMSKLLKQSPHIIDCYVQGSWQYPQPFDDEYVTKAENYELQLERLRRFVNEYLYQLYQSFLEGEMSPDLLQAALSDLAEHTLELSIELVKANLQLEESPISIIGLGKVALRRMSPLSDLDLVFAYQNGTQTDTSTATRFISRLQTAIATPMREGIVYELDTRLRPSGRSGAPIVSADSFAKHHSERAHTWEHIALVPSRVIAGDMSLVEQFDQIKRCVISTPRDLKQLKTDAYKMWLRIGEHRIQDVPIEKMQSKLRVGGLMQAEYLAACLILNSGSTLDVTDVSFDFLLSQISIGETSGNDLAEVIQFWRIQQSYERLFGLAGHTIDTLAAHYLQQLLKHSGVETLNQLIDKKAACVELVRGANELFFADINLSSSQLNDWQEKNVAWI